MEMQQQTYPFTLVVYNRREDAIHYEYVYEHSREAVETNHLYKYGGADEEYLFYAVYPERLTTQGLAAAVSNLKAEPPRLQQKRAMREREGEGIDPRTEYAYQYVTRNFLRNIFFFGIGVVVVIKLTQLIHPWVGIAGFLFYALIAVVDGVRMVITLAAGVGSLFLSSRRDMPDVRRLWQATLIQVIETAVFLGYTYVLYRTFWGGGF